MSVECSLIAASLDHPVVDSFSSPIPILISPSAYETGWTRSSRHHS